ncbi:hypothetical protein M1523_04880 [Patescibacteria group bacterium]|nr:hypothetical protein [Patescibacteria group bacterium]MCL5091579.1 hypothetical protein [Patescibacteria group bacterium]
MVEQQAPISETASQPRDRFCLYIAGALGTNQNIQEIRRSLTGKYGDHALVVDSVISRDGMRRPDRFKIMAQRLVDEFTSGRDLVVVAHSFGAPEINAVISQIEKTRPELLEPNSEFLQKLNLVLVAPFGFVENARQAAGMMKRFTEVARTQLILPLIPPSQLMGIESTMLVPVAGLDQTSLTEAITCAYSAKSQYGQVDRVVVLKNPKDYSELAQLPSERKNELGQLDAELGQAAKEKNWPLFRTKLVERGLCLRRQMAEAYQGKYFPGYEAKPEERSIDAVGKGIGVALLGLERWLSLFGQSLAGKPYQRVMELRKRGAAVKFLVPEYDAILKSAEAKRFLGIESGQPSADLVIMRGQTHASFANQGDVLVQGLEVLGL